MRVLIVTALVVGGLILVVPPGAMRPAAVKPAILGAAAGAVAALSAQHVFGIVAVTAVAAVAGGCAPGLWRKRRARLDRHREREAWPDAIDTVRAGVRAGAPLPEAVIEAAVRVPESLRPRFAAAAARLAVGEAFGAAIRRLDPGPDRDPVAARVVAVLTLADDVGSADTGQVLDSLVGFIRSDLAQQRDIAARHSWNVAAARLAVVAPWLTVAALSLQPSGRAAYATTGGTVLLLVVAAASALAYAVMTRFGRAGSALGGT